MTNARLLTTKEACHYLFGKCNRTTKVRMYNYFKRGVLGTIKLSNAKNGQHYWRTKDLDELIKSGTGYEE